MFGIILTVVHVIACFLLIIVILLQAGRGQGLASASFGSGNVQSLFGTRAGDFLTKATTVAAICFLVTCVSLDILEAQKSRSLLRTSQGQSPIDIEQIKKALEKVKAEVPSSPASPEDKSKAEVTGTAEQAVQAAKAASENAPAAPAVAAVPADVATAPEQPAKS